MKVNAWKTVEVECEVDVALDDCISELLNIANSEDGPRRKLQAIDGATKILERITPEIVADRLRQNPGALTLIRERLTKWIAATECVMSSTANPYSDLPWKGE